VWITSNEESVEAVGGPRSSSASIAVAAEAEEWSGAREVEWEKWEERRLSVLRMGSARLMPGSRERARLPAIAVLRCADGAEAGELRYALAGGMGARSRGSDVVQQAGCALGEAGRGSTFERKQ
jgi:hypothetical protein